MQKALCEKPLLGYLTNLIHIILSLMNDFVTELLISAVCAALCFHR